MSEETTTEAPPKRGRPPRKKNQPDGIPAGYQMAADADQGTSAVPKWEDIIPQSGKPHVTPKLPNPEMIPAPPIHIEDAKALEWMDWIYTHLPNKMARNFYGGLNYTPRS